MGSISDRFPYTEINEPDALQLKLMWGMPKPEREAVDNFIHMSGMPMVSDSSVLTILKLTSVTIADTFDLPVSEAQSMFLKGAYLYSGTLSVASWFNSVPVDKSVLHDLANADVYDVTSSACERLEKDAASFLRLVRPVWEVLGGESSAYRYLGMIGAGLVHIITVDSDRVMADVDLLEGSLGSELNGLEDVFQTIESEWGL